MSGTDRASIVLFWLMIAAGFAVLTPGLVIPAWVDYQRSLALHAQRAAVLDRMEREIAAQARQIEHLQHDAAYNERLMLEESDAALHDPSVETVLVQPAPPRARTEDGPPQAARLQPGDRFPLLTTVMHRALDRRAGWMRVFLDQGARRVAIAMSIGLIAGATLLLARRAPAHCTAADAPDDGADRTPALDRA